MAEKYFEHGELILNKYGTSWGMEFVVYFLNLRGTHYKDYGEYKLAVKDFSQCLDLLDKSITEGMDKDFYFKSEAIYRTNLGNCYLLMKEYKMAGEEFKTIMDRQHLFDSDFLLVEFYHYWIEYLIEVKDHSKAESALLFIEEKVNKLNNAYFFSRQEFLTAKNIPSDFDLKRKYLERAANILVHEKNIQFSAANIQMKDLPIDNYQAMFYLLRYYFLSSLEKYKTSRKIEDFDIMINIFDEFDFLVQKVTMDFNSENSQITHLQNIYDVYEQMIEALLIKDNPENKKKALEICMKNKSNILQMNKRIKQTFSSIVEQESYSKLFEIEEELDKLDEDLQNATGIRKEELLKTYLKLTRHKNSVIEKIENEYPVLQKMKRVISPDVDLIKGNLLEDQMLIEIFYGNEAVYIFGLTKNDILIETVELSNELTELLDQTSNQLVQKRSKEEYLEVAKGVYDQCFKVFIDNLDAEIQNLLVVPDGIFHELPLEVLWDGKQFLIEKYDINYLISSMQLESMDNFHYSSSYFGFGTNYSNELNNRLSEQYNIVDQPLSVLKTAELEILESASNFESEVLIGSNATKKTFIQKSQESVEIIHLALHGINLTKDLSGLIFHEKNDSFILTSNEIYGLNLDNNLTILSSCNSGKGEIFKGEGSRSLARSFLFAGSENVMPSLWEANDKSNQTIMTHFLEGSKSSKNLSKVLADSKRDYLKHSSPTLTHPSYWGNMILIGTGQTEQASSSTYWLFLLMLALLIGLVTYRRWKV